MTVGMLLDTYAGDASNIEFSAVNAPIYLFTDREKINQIQKTYIVDSWYIDKENTIKITGKRR